MNQSVLDRITRYYDETSQDYRLIWGTSKHLSMHVGYSDENAYKHDRAVTRMIRELVSRANITPADRVIDLGCGLGGSSIWLAKNIGCPVTGVDINPRSVNTARTQAQKRKVERLVTFILSDYTSVPVKRHTFSVAWFLESLCYAADKQRALKEAGRLLMPGGRLVIADGFKVAEGEELDTWLKGWAVPALATVPEIRSSLETAGFRVRYEDVTARVMSSLKRLHDCSKALYPVGKVLEKLGWRIPIQTGNIRGAIYAYESLCQGQWRYGIFVAEKAS